MIVYITKPDTHEFIMGGFRHVLLWTKEPHYLHMPILDNMNHNSYKDRGWEISGYSTGTVAKPLLKQDLSLLEKVGNIISWSCCPKGIELHNWQEWANKNNDDAQYNNFSNLLWHRPYGKEADANCNVNYKRFLLSVNLRTNDIELIKPHIHWYYGEKSQGRSVFSEQTFEIEHQYATNESYILENNDDKIPF